MKIKLTYLTHKSDKPEESGIAWQPYIFTIDGKNQEEYYKAFTKAFRKMKKDTSAKKFELMGAYYIGIENNWKKPTTSSKTKLTKKDLETE